MNKKYYADITLDFDEMHYSIVGDLATKKQEIVNLIEEFAKARDLICDTKKKKLYKDGKEVGYFNITSRSF